MEIDEKRVILPTTLSLKYEGKIIEESDTHITIEGEGDDSYIKIFNPFRGVAKLLLFENERWVDAETSSGISNFDFSSLGLDDLSSLSPDDHSHPVPLKLSLFVYTPSDFPIPPNDFLFKSIPC